MKSKFPKSFILLILVVAITSAMLVSAHANTGTAVFGSITAVSSGNGTNYYATDYSSEYGTASQGTTNYFTDSYSSTSGYASTTVFSGSTTYSEPSLKIELTDFTIKELFALLEESLDNDIAEAEENGGDVEAISKVAAEIKQEISEMEQDNPFDFLRLRDFPDFINESYEREGIAPSEITQEIIAALETKINEMWAGEVAPTEPQTGSQNPSINDYLDMIEKIFEKELIDAEESGKNIEEIRKINNEVKEKIAYAKESQDYTDLLSYLESVLEDGSVISPESSSEIDRIVRLIINKLYAGSVATTAPDSATQPNEENECRCKCCVCRICKAINDFFAWIISKISGIISMVC